MGAENVIPKRTETGQRNIIYSHKSVSGMPKTHLDNTRYDETLEFNRNFLVHGTCDSDAG